MTPRDPNTEKYIHRAFTIGLIFKGFNSLLEIIGGVLFLFTFKITSLIESLIQSELIEDPTDFFATYLQHYMPYLSVHTQLYASFYLLSHGIIKIVLVIFLFQKKLWAYPATIGVLSLFILYQVYRLAHTHSLTLFFLTLFDILLIWLTWHEYQVMKKHQNYPIL